MASYALQEIREFRRSPTFMETKCPSHRARPVWATLFYLLKAINKQTISSGDSSKNHVTPNSSTRSRIFDVRGTITPWRFGICGHQGKQTQPNSRKTCPETRNGQNRELDNGFAPNNILLQLLAKHQISKVR